MVRSGLGPCGRCGAAALAETELDELADAVDGGGAGNPVDLASDGRLRVRRARTGDRSGRQIVSTVASVFDGGVCVRRAVVLQLALVDRQAEAFGDRAGFDGGQRSAGATEQGERGDNDEIQPARAAGGRGAVFDAGRPGKRVIIR